MFAYLFLWALWIWVALILPFFGAFAWVMITDPKWRSYGRRIRKQYLLNCAMAAACWPVAVPWMLWKMFVA